jgi:hypothetical protein
MLNAFDARVDRESSSCRQVVIAEPSFLFCFSCARRRDHRIVNVVLFFANPRGIRS